MGGRLVATFEWRLVEYAVAYEGKGLKLGQWLLELSEDPRKQRCKTEPGAVENSSCHVSNSAWHRLCPPPDDSSLKISWANHSRLRPKNVPDQSLDLFMPPWIIFTFGLMLLQISCYDLLCVRTQLPNVHKTTAGIGRIRQQRCPGCDQVLVSCQSSLRDSTTIMNSPTTVCDRLNKSTDGAVTIRLL